MNQDVRFINNIDLNNINSSKPSLYKLKSTKKPQITINLTPDKLEPTLVINLNDLDYKEPKVINKKLTNKKPSLDKKYLLETINLNNRSNTIRDASELDYKEPKYNRKKINKSNLRYNPSINISIITPDIIISNKTNNLEKLDYSVPNIKSKNIKSRLKTKKINKKITIPKVETIDTLKDLNLDTRIPELKICINKDKFKLCKPEIACDFIDPGENIKITEPEDFDKDLLEINLDLRYLNNKDHSLNIKIEDTDLEIPEIDLSKVLKNLKAKKYSTGLNSNEEDLLNKYKNQLYKL